MDVQALAEKGVRFESPKVVVAASLCERLLPLLDDQAEIAVVEDGTAFVADDTELDDAVLRRYGTRLYVNGDLSLNQRSRDALAKLEKLYVTGAVRSTVRCGLSARSSMPSANRSGRRWTGRCWRSIRAACSSSNVPTCASPRMFRRR